MFNIRNRDHHAKFEIDMTTLTCLNQRKDLTVADVRTEPKFIKALLLLNGKSFLNIIRTGLFLGHQLSNCSPWGGETEDCPHPSSYGE